MEEPSSLHGGSPSLGGSRSSISSLLNDDAAASDASQVEHFASYGSPFPTDFGSPLGYNPASGSGEPASKRQRPSPDSSSMGDVHPLHHLSFPSLQLYPLGSNSTEAAQTAVTSATLEQERRVLAEERQQVAADRQQLADERRAFEAEKRQFLDEKQKWLEQQQQQAPTTTTASSSSTATTTTTASSKPATTSRSLFGRRPATPLEAQSFGCAFVKNGAIVSNPSPKHAQATVVLLDMLTQQQVELPLAIGIGAKDSSLPKKAVQDLGCILIPQQTRDYGPSQGKTGYLMVALKDQKGGAPVRVEAVEGCEGDVAQSYFVITRSDLSLLRCVAHEKEGTISNDVPGEAGEPPAKSSKRKK